MLWLSLAKLTMEANSVIASRLALMASGAITATEAQLMITEKVFAAAEAGVILGAGGNVGKVVNRYRRHVRKNARRLQMQSPAEAGLSIYRFGFCWPGFC
jgi:hypothetical protein